MVVLFIRIFGWFLVNSIHCVTRDHEDGLRILEEELKRIKHVEGK